MYSAFVFFCVLATAQTDVWPLIGILVHVAPWAECLSQSLQKFGDTVKALIANSECPCQKKIGQDFWYIVYRIWLQIYIARRSKLQFCLIGSWSSYSCHSSTLRFMTFQDHPMYRYPMLILQSLWLYSDLLRFLMN